MIDHIQRAHERLLSSLPVRTHTAKPVVKRTKGQLLTRDQRRALWKRIRALRAKKMTQYAISLEVRVSEPTVSRYLRMKGMPK